MLLNSNCLRTSSMSCVAHTMLCTASVSSYSHLALYSLNEQCYSHLALHSLNEQCYSHLALHSLNEQCYSHLVLHSLNEHCPVFVQRALLGSSGRTKTLSWNPLLRVDSFTGHGVTSTRTVHYPVHQPAWTPAREALKCAAALCFIGRSQQYLLSCVNAACYCFFFQWKVLKRHSGEHTINA